MNTVIPTWPLPAIPVAGSDARFPVRRIFCVGRNYAEHAREMGGNPEREPPFFFMKPADAILTSGRMDYPPQTADLQHEIGDSGFDCVRTPKRPMAFFAGLCG